MTSRSDKVFLLRDQGTNQNTTFGQSSLDKTIHRFESALIRYVIRGREISGFLSPTSNYFFVYPYLNGRLAPGPNLLESYPLTYRYLSRYKDVLCEKSKNVWHSLIHHNTPHLQENTIICSKITPFRGFALARASQNFLHGSAFACQIMDDKINPDLLLAYFNSRFFWHYVESCMQIYGGKYGMIKLSLLKKHRVPKGIAFPDHQTIGFIKALNHHIAKQKLQRRADKEVLDDLYAKLDDVIERLVTQPKGSILFDTDLS